MSRAHTRNVSFLTLVVTRALECAIVSAEARRTCAWWEG